MNKNKNKRIIFLLFTSCYVFSTRSNCCEFLASGGVILQSDYQSFFKAQVCGAFLLYFCSIVDAKVILKIFMKKKKNKIAVDIG